LFFLFCFFLNSTVEKNILLLKLMTTQEKIKELDTLLYRVGSLYPNATRVRQDTCAVLMRYGNLSALLSLFPGSPQRQLVSLLGTVPVNYRGGTYNIPVQVWLVESYPLTYPIAYVTPTQGMMIKARHQHVDDSGKCYFPYLSNWHYASSTLIGLLDVMVAAFSLDPPVRAIPQQQQQQQQRREDPPPPSYERHQSFVAAQPPTAVPSQSFVARQPAQSMPNIHFANTYQSSGVPTLHDLAAKRVRARLELERRNSVASLEALLTEQAHGGRGGDELRRQVRELGDAVKRQDDALRRIADDVGRVDAWIQANGKSELDVDNIEPPRDALTAQLWDQVAENAAWDDSIYVYSRRFFDNPESLTLDAFLRSIRASARSQFRCKALIRKIQVERRHQLK
jgi:ESCRT-I complex subunit TSG101